MALHNNSIDGIVREIAQMKDRLIELETSIHITLNFQADKITELESLVNPFSSEGTAICNINVENDI
jgi:hypothetical protein